MNCPAVGIGGITLQGQCRAVCHAPAKINLLLRIPGRFEGGFHLIHTLICPIRLADRIEISVLKGERGVSLETQFSPELHEHQQAALANNPELEVSIATISSPANLAFRAAEAFLRHFSLEGSFGVSIKLEKRVPFQAGLGGGSSDAAAVLRALAVIFNFTEERAAIYDIGASLGSDIPALIANRLILAFGRGERLAELSPSGEGKAMAQLGLVVVKGLAGVSTPQAYKALGFSPTIKQDENASFYELGSREYALETSRELKSLGFEIKDEVSPACALRYREKLTLFEREGSSGMPDSIVTRRPLVDHFANDFQRVVRELVPEVNEVSELLEECGSVKTLLAGSGGAVFGIVPSVDKAKQLAERVRNKARPGWFIVETALSLYDR